MTGPQPQQAQAVSPDRIYLRATEDLYIRADGRVVSAQEVALALQQARRTRARIVVIDDTAD